MPQPRASRRPRRALLAVFVALVATGAAGAVGSSRVAGAPAPPDARADPLVRLAWVGDPATSVTVRWRGGGTGSIRVRPADTTAWAQVRATPVTLPGGSVESEATLGGLTPATSYEYQVADGAGTWSPAASFTTAGTESVTMAFVADTGIAGRIDGLATGTEQVVEELAALDVDVVLGGGDYAVSDTDIRFATQDAASDAWLATMQPVLRSTPFMPTYGDHETLIGETVDRWAARFPTPEGDVGRLSYSFDVAGVHVVSLHAFEGPISETTLAWLRSDLDAAVARGVRTIVPFLHRNVYGDGVAHPPSASLARQLSAVFEQYPVDVVLTAHDQSYERTFPLIGGDPTTSARSCSTSADGIVWVKSSPGGKLGDATRGFSGYSTPSPSPAIAVREGALHHVTVVRADPTGLEVVTYGIAGDGAPPVVVDRFERRDACTPSSEWTSQPIAVLGDGSVVTAAATLAAATPDVSLTASVPWLSATIGAAGDVLVQADTAGLPPGRHAATLDATAGDGRPATLPVVVIVPDPTGGIELVTSAPDRSGAAPLDGATVGRQAFVELRAPFSDVASVTFAVDGVTVRSESERPFDLGGGGALPRAFDTAALADGAHRLDATITFADGTSTVIGADFLVANAAPAAPGGAAAEPGAEPPIADAAASPVPGVTTPRAAPPAAAGVDHRRPWWTSAPLLVAAAALAGIAVGVLGRRRWHDATPTGDDDVAIASESEREGYVSR